MLENKFKQILKEEIEYRIPNSIVIFLDPTYFQGIPDLLILFKKKWAMLEVKKSKKESYQPNQEWYIALFNKMSFASVIYPENKEEVLNEMERALRSSR